jgi:dATP pyrophosphohydrolase
MPAIISTMIEVCIFKFERDRPHYLLLKRREDEKIYPGIWQYVTGSLEDDEKAVNGALRELKEETGFQPVHFWSVPFENSFYDASNDRIQLVPVFGAQVESGSPPVLSPEHSEYQWLSYREAYKRLVWPGQKEGLRIVHEYIVFGEKPADLLKMF